MRRRNAGPLCGAEATLIDSMKPVKADDSKYTVVSYAPSCAAEFETPRQLQNRVKAFR